MYKFIVFFAYNKRTNTYTNYSCDIRILFDRRIFVSLHCMNAHRLYKHVYTQKNGRLLFQRWSDHKNGTFSRIPIVYSFTGRYAFFLYIVCHIAFVVCLSFAKLLGISFVQLKITVPTSAEIPGSNTHSCTLHIPFRTRTYNDKPTKFQVSKENHGNSRLIENISTFVPKSLHVNYVGKNIRYMKRQG